MRAETACKVDHGKITPRETAGQLLCSPRTWGWSAGCDPVHRPAPVLPTHVGMVRRRRTDARERPRAPHARGDGPARVRSGVLTGQCSPRTWGWSGGDERGTDGACVLPTHVGMVRGAGASIPRRACAPHARGDGPPPTSPARPSAGCSPRTWGWSDAQGQGVAVRAVLPTHVGMVRAVRGGPTQWAACSPRTWGWSGAARRVGRVGDVLPTHVGMVRADQRPQTGRDRAPHARGDGPSVGQFDAANPSCSPRTWGWSDSSGLPDTLNVVLPTHVGMVRPRLATASRARCAPHARGDGPFDALLQRFAKACSPRTWGWSGGLEAARPRSRVLPTHVGMVRPCRSSCGWPAGAPHARGDGPFFAYERVCSMECSPRTWGWSVGIAASKTWSSVLPTHVGMVRTTRQGQSDNHRAPHARGDGPSCSRARRAGGACSPRTWGWSVGGLQANPTACVLPTHVGMVRRPSSG